ncbi:MAG: S8 family serine peptidase [bacterium]|nr:S8 family serine peptidase [bacterium]
MGDQSMTTDCTNKRFAAFALAILVAWFGLTGCPSTSQAGSGHRTPYWIFFHDKQAGTVEKVYVDPYALERRRVRGSVDLGEDIDRPVSPEYRREVLSFAGVSLRGESRWLNALSIEADSAALIQIAALPCVKGIKAVAYARRATYDGGISKMEIFPRLSVNERMESQSVDDLTQPDPTAPNWRMDRAWYGPSLNQARMVNALETHFRGNFGAGVRIAVLDGGFQRNHEAFQKMDLIAEYDFINNDENTSFDPAQDGPGQAHHGTATSSVIGGYMPGNLIGLAHEASFILCKTENDAYEKPIEEDNWVRAVEWCEALGADVLSSSLSYKDWYTPADYDGLSAPTSRAANIAYELGMILCTSAGNEGPDHRTLGVPADAEGVLAIGALRPDGDLAAFSSRGPCSDGRIKPDVCAQGVRTACVQPDTWNQYAFWNGTSLSCPVAAGCLALLVAEHPDWTPAQCYTAIRETASRATKPDNDWGWGLINLEEAIAYPSVSGWVLDQQGRGLSNVVIRLFGQDEKLNTLTDQDGFYRFSNLSWEGIRVQVVWKDGSLSPVRILSVPPSEEADFKVER